jgi:hypothetical protein
LQESHESVASRFSAVLQMLSVKEWKSRVEMANLPDPSEEAGVLGTTTTLVGPASHVVPAH